MVIDVTPELCIGCRLCEWACSFWHNKVNSPTKSRITVVRDEAGTLDIPVVCLQCDDPPCSAACPTGALRKDDVTGLVEYDPDRCVGCRMCVVACPFGAIAWDPDSRRILKCDLCGGDPQCVKVCPTEALKFVRADVSHLRKRMRAAERIKNVL